MFWLKVSKYKSKALFLGSAITLHITEQRINFPKMFREMLFVTVGVSRFRDGKSVLI